MYLLHTTQNNYCFLLPETLKEKSGKPPPHYKTLASLFPMYPMPVPDNTRRHYTIPLLSVCVWVLRTSMCLSENMSVLTALCCDNALSPEEQAVLCDRGDS